MLKKKNWSEKLKDSKGLPKVEKITPKMSQRWGIGTVVIPAPIEVDAMMKKVPKGKLITINEIRQALAKKHKATISCPLTTGIFAWVAANAAEEQRQQSKKNTRLPASKRSNGGQVTPYWRTLKTEGIINEKYPGGAQVQKKLLVKEGHKVVQKGKKFRVVDYEKSLAKI